MTEHGEDDATVSVQELLIREVTELRAAVGTLSNRTEALSSSFRQVNELTAKQQRIDQQAQLAIREAASALAKLKALDEIVIPREEHEKRWTQEQEALIALRLRIKRRGLIQSGITLVLSLVALGVAVWIVLSQSNANADEARKACQDRVNISTTSLPAYDRLLSSPTIGHDAVLKGFIELARQNALKNSQVKCG